MRLKWYLIITLMWLVLPVAMMVSLIHCWH